MKILITAFTLLMCVEVCAANTENVMAYGRLPLPGTGSGDGIITIGNVNRPVPLSVNVSAGDTVAAICTKLIAANNVQKVFEAIKYDTHTSTIIFVNISLSNIYFRSTDSGFKLNPGVSNLKAFADVATKSVTLNWTNPTDLRAIIVIWKSGVGKELPPANNTYKDIDFGNGAFSRYITYSITCLYKNDNGDIIGCSDVSTVTCDNPDDIQSNLLGITTSMIDSIPVNSDFKTQLKKSGGVNPVNWALDQGALPSGFTLQPSGTLFGTTNSVGTSSFTVRVTDASGATATQLLVIKTIPDPTLTRP